MSKIIRYNGDVPAFAQDAPGTERTVFNENTQSDILDDNVNESYKRGFGIYGPTDLPTRADLNGFGFTVSQMTAYLYQKGIAEWNQYQEFFTDSFTNFEGKIYTSDIDDNVGINPKTNISAAINDGATLPISVATNSSMVAFRRNLGFAQEFAYIDGTNIELKRRHFDSGDYSDISTTTLASLGITPGNNIVSCRMSDTRFFLGYDDQYHVLEVDFGTGVISVKFSDTTTVLSESGGLPYTCSFQSELITTGSYDYVYLLINGIIKSYRYNISTEDFSIFDSSITPDSFTAGSPVLHIGQEIRVPGEMPEVLASVLAVCDISTGLLSVYINHNNGILLGTLDYGDCSLMALSSDYNFMITSVDPLTGNGLVQRINVDLDYTNETTFKTEFNFSSDKFDTGSTGLQSIVSLQVGNMLISNSALNTIKDYFFSDAPAFGWSLLSVGTIAFDGTGTALASTNVEDAIKEVLTSMVYPVGAIYESALDDNTNPSVTLGFGTWTQIEGRMLIGVDLSDSDLDTAGLTGGNRNLTAAGHILTEAEMPAHTHTIGNDPGSTSVSGVHVRSESQETGLATTDSTGGGLAHSHGIAGESDGTSLPPFLVVYMWQRTA